MQKLFFICLLFISVALFSQDQKLENLTPQYTVVNYKKASFPGGDNAYRKELYKMIHGYIDLSTYAANGVFTFSFDVDIDGKTKNLSVSPKVKNSELFIEDMLFCMKKIKTKWTPATENGVPVKSKYTIKINFVTDHFD